MKIISPKDALYVEKPEGTKVTYYLRDEYEVHYNEQTPRTTQTWHHHKRIRETLYIIEGELTAKWRDNGLEISQIVKKGDLIETEATPHTFVNHTDKIVKFLVIKQVPHNRSFKELLKTDKVLDQ